MTIASPQRTALFLLCGAITMFFTALTSAMLVRRGFSNDWQGVPLPPLLYANTAVLLASTFTSRGVSVFLGFVFLAGQIAVWWPLSIGASPGNSFFLVFTVAHAAHILSGIAALTFGSYGFARRYWHFLTGLWIYLMLLFVLWANR